MLFTPFERIGSNVSFQDGAGLGLAISKQIAGLLGGEITVQSQESVGSKFVLSIPIQVNYPSREGLAEPIPPTDGVFCRGLCIGNRLTFGSTICQYLKKHNLELDFVENVQIALEVSFFFFFFFSNFN